MKQSRFARIAEIAGEDDWYDKWGTAMSLFFDVAEVLDMTDIEGDVTPGLFAQWQYRRSPMVTVPAVETVAARAKDFSRGRVVDDYTYSVVALAVAYRDEIITQADLVYAGRNLEDQIGCGGRHQARHRHHARGNRKPD